MLSRLLILLMIMTSVVAQQAMADGLRIYAAGSLTTAFTEMFNVFPARSRYP